MARLNSFLFLSLVVALNSQASAEGWGDLRGKIVFDGKAPARTKLVVNKDEAFCGPFNLLSEDLVVGEDGGVRDVVVSLYLGRGDAAPPIHESYDETADAEVRLDNKNCRFDPRICLLRTTQTLVVGNPDQVAHNTNVQTFKNPGVNPMIPWGAQLKMKFKSAESFPATVSCNIHPWMQGRLVIKDNPYMAVTDEKGEFVIKNLPAGKHTFHFWHQAGNIDSVTRDGKKEEWSRGRVEFEIEDGDENNLGEIKVPAAVLQ